MLPSNTSRPDATFLKLKEAFLEIFGKPGTAPRREPDGSQGPHPKLELTRQEMDGLRR
jgi:hypothetical protein